MPGRSGVAVVGGGYAGLAAAWHLSRAGVPVTLFERSGHLGGLAMTFPVGEGEIEKYYHHWFTSDVDVLGLIDELGLADRLRWISPVMGLFCHGRIWRFTSPMDLLRFRPFSPAAKLRFGLVTLFLQRYPRVDPFEEVTADAWLRRWAGDEVYGTVWGPLLRAKFGRNADRISMAWIWNKMRLRGNSRVRGGHKESLGYLAGGFGVLTRALAAAIEEKGGCIRTSERVLEVRPRPAGGFEVRTTKRTEGFDAVISTVAPPLLARLAPALPEEYRRRCEGFEHAAIVCTLVELRRSFSPIYWMNVSDPEIPFGGLIEHTNFLSPAHYGDRHLLYVSHYTYPDDPVFGLDAGELFAHYLEGFRRIEPSFSPDWVERRLTFRDRWAQPIVTVGYQRRLLPLETPLEGLYAATMAQVYPQDRGTNYAIRIGTAAAERLLASAHARGTAVERLASGGRS